VQGRLLPFRQLRLRPQSQGGRHVARSARGVCMAGRRGGASASSGSGGAQDGPSLADYLEFGRLLGEKPEDVERGLQEAGLPVARDARANEYLQE